MGLVGGAIQLDEGLVNGYLVQDVGADQRLGDLGVHVGHGLLHALAQVTALVAVPQLTGLIDAGGSAGGHSGAAHGAVLQDDLHLDGGIAAGVNNFTAEDINNFKHLFHGNQAPFNFRNLIMVQTPL